MASNDALYLKAAIAALQKAARDAEDEVPVGRHQVDVRVVADVRGSCLQSGAERYSPIQEVCLNKDFLLLLLQYAGVTREAAVAAVPDAVRAMLGGGKAKEGYETLAQDLNKGIEALHDIYAALPKKERKGKFTPRIQAVEVQILPAAPGEENVAAAG